MGSYLERVAAAGARHWRQPAGLRRVFRPGIYPAVLGDIPVGGPEQSGGADAVAEPRPAEQEPPSESGAAPRAAGPDHYVGIAPTRDRPSTDSPRRAARTPDLSTPGLPPVEAPPRRHQEAPGGPGPASAGAPQIVPRPRASAGSSRGRRRPGPSAETRLALGTDKPSTTHATEEPSPRTPQAGGRTESRPAGEPAARGRTKAAPAPKASVPRGPAISLEPPDASHRGESPGVARVASELPNHQAAEQQPVSAGSTPAGADQPARVIPEVSWAADSVVAAALAMGSPGRTAGAPPVSPRHAGPVPASVAGAPIAPMPQGAGSPSVPRASAFGVDRSPAQRESKASERATIVIGRMAVEVVHRPAVVRPKRPSAAPAKSGSLDRGHLGRFKLTP